MRVSAAALGIVYGWHGNRHGLVYGIVDGVDYGMAWFACDDADLLSVFIGRC